MKAILGMTALAALMLGASVTTVQAEGGYDWLEEYRQEQQAKMNKRSSQDSAGRFVQMLEEQPTAAGPEREQQPQRIEKSQPGRDEKNRVIFGVDFFGPH